MQQYELRWADMPEPIGRRPVLLSRTPAYEYLSKVIVAEITATIRDIPQEVGLGQREGLNRPSAANLDDLHVVAKTAWASRSACSIPGGAGRSNARSATRWTGRS